MRKCLLFAIGIVGYLTVPLQTQSAQANPTHNRVEPSTDPAGAEITPLASDASLDPAVTDTDADEANPMAQVRSVSELTDVSPSDWAYQALKALVERYDVLEGYPGGGNSTARRFRGNQPLTRQEFAAVLNRVLDRLTEQVTESQQRIFQVREDLATVRRLQATYAQIATSLGERMDQLDRQIVDLTDNQFSTTTKLGGQTVLALTNGSNARATLLSRTRLDLQTSFSGQDLLLTQLEAGNNGGDAISKEQGRGQNLLGTVGVIADGGGLDYVAVDSTLRLSKLRYTFQPLDTLSVTVGARLSPRDFIDYNRFANDSATNFSSSFFVNNPLIVQNAIDRPGGAGIVLDWKPVKTLPLMVRALYVAANAEQPNGGFPEGGLFGDRNQGSLEVEYALSENLITRLQYTQATVNGVEISAFGLNAEWNYNQRFGVFGRLGFGRYRGFNPFLNQDLDLNPFTWQIGASLRNIVIPGSTAGLALGQPFVESDLGEATQTNVEAYFTFLLNDSVSVTPAVLVVNNPDNRDRGMVWQWVFRLVFSF